MPTSGGGFEQVYNVQAGVDTETMLIVTTHVTQAPNDKKEMEPPLTNLKQLPIELGAVTDVLSEILDDFNSQTDGLLGSGNRYERAIDNQSVALTVKNGICKIYCGYDVKTNFFVGTNMVFL